MRVKRIGLFVLIAIILLQGCSKVSFNYNDGYTDGIVTEDGWENSFFNLKFILPEDYTILTDMPENEEFIKTEFDAGFKTENESGQHIGATITIQVSQLPEGISDEEIRNMNMDAVLQEGLTADMISSGITKIADEDFSLIEFRMPSDSGYMKCKRLDRRRDSKLLTIILMYLPYDWDPKLENFFRQIE